MSLLRLLSTGRSWVSDSTDNANRYQMGNPGLLPKFGSRAQTRPAKERGQPERAVAPQPAPAVQPVAPAIEPVNNSQPENPAQKAKAPSKGIYRSWLERIKSRVYVKPQRASAPRVPKAPVQTELSLDKVQVVRNDLSDTDLEIVPARRDASRIASTRVSKPVSAEVEASRSPAMALQSGKK